MRKNVKSYSKNTVVFFASVLFFLLTSSFLRTIFSTQATAFRFTAMDSVTVEVFAFFDIDSTLAGYKAYIFSPVCDDSSCYPVEIELYWDELGNFQKYELLPGKELTKMDHEPFSAKDYEKLTQLLSNRNPAFGGMSREDLIGDVANDRVDGYSGATILGIKDEVIQGAVYSCYTLWHIAHGAATDSIQKYTQAFLSPALVQKLVGSEDSEAWYYLVDHFTEDDFEQYADEVLLMMEKSNGYLAQKALEKLPSDLLGNSSFQDSLSTLFPSLDYYARKSLMKRLHGHLNSDALGRVLTESLESRSSLHSELIIGIFSTANGKLSDELFAFFFQQLREKQVPLTRDQYKCLESLARKNREFKSEIKQLKQNIN